MSEKGPLPGFNQVDGGNWHLHEFNLEWKEVEGYRNDGFGVIEGLRIVDECPVKHLHNLQPVAGTNVLLKPVK